MPLTTEKQAYESITNFQVYLVYTHVNKFLYCFHMYNHHRYLGTYVNVSYNYWLPYAIYNELE